MKQNVRERRDDDFAFPASFSLDRLMPERIGTGFAEDVRAGLTVRPKRLPSKYFYDARGSRLYEAICRTPEYYPARTEALLLARFADDIVDAARPQTIIEFGSGASRKTVQIFRACERQSRRVRYVPVDICSDMLARAGREVAVRHPWLEVAALVGDYTLGLAHLPPQPAPLLFLFLGGTVGNFGQDEAATFLAELRAAMQADDWLLLGADRVKDPAVLHAAYNDSAGVTAQFNLNLLRVMNRELGARFDVRAFTHDARFNPGLAQIEMRLCANRAHTVGIPGVGEIGFEQGESILTEISRKFTSASLAQLLRDAGFRLRRQYQPANRYFTLALASPA